MGKHLSLILLPTLECNVACDYCFEDKTGDVLTSERLAEIVDKVFDHMDRTGVESLTIHWQGGEIMTLPPAWFERAYDAIGAAAEARGKRVEHGLQSNLIGYTKRWNGVIARMFGNSVGTSMDFPNLHRKLFQKGPDEYTRIWRRHVDQARAAGIDIQVIAVLNRATLDVGAESFYSYFVDELGFAEFQVNTPFPGGEQNDAKRDLGLDIGDLTRFHVDLLDVWMERGYGRGVSVGPLDELLNYFLGGSACLPCIWQANCTDEFLSIDARGNVAQCDCWVTSYPDHFFGNVFQSESLTDLLENSRPRERFLERPAVVADQGCIECEFLALCHGGCPVRTYTILGTLLEKDPYCGLYKGLFARTAEVARTIAATRGRAVVPTLLQLTRAARTADAVAEVLSEGG
jgi:uncharacterized protein